MREIFELLFEVFVLCAVVLLVGCAVYMMCTQLAISWTGAN